MLSRGERNRKQAERELSLIAIFHYTEEQISSSGLIIFAFIFRAFWGSKIFCASRKQKRPSKPPTQRTSQGKNDSFFFITTPVADLPLATRVFHALYHSEPYFHLITQHLLRNDVWDGAMWIWRHIKLCRLLHSIFPHEDEKRFSFFRFVVEAMAKLLCCTHHKAIRVWSIFLYHSDSDTSTSQLTTFCFRTLNVSLDTVKPLSARRKRDFRLIMGIITLWRSAAVYEFIISSSLRQWAANVMSFKIIIHQGVSIYISFLAIELLQH